MIRLITEGSGILDRLLKEQGLRVEESKSVEGIYNETNTVWIDNTIPDILSVSNLIGEVPLILSNKAVGLLVSLGIESDGKIEESTLELTSDPWDKRGFQSYKRHSLFDGLHGGFYSIHLNTLKELPGVNYYHGTLAKTVAVEKRYISYLRDKRVIWLYNTFGAPLIAIGGLLDFQTKESPYMAEVKRFVKNLIGFMQSPEVSEKYWPAVEKGFVQKVSMRKPNNVGLKTVTRWPESSICLTDPGDYLSTSGSRLLANLSKSGIEEVWVHPFRILKSLSLSIDGIPFKECLKSVDVSPDRVTYALGNGTLTVFASLAKPYLFIQYDSIDNEAHEIAVDFRSDMRIMWPMDVDFNGRKIHWSDQRYWYCQTADGDIRTAILSSQSVVSEVVTEEDSVAGLLRSRFLGRGVFAVVSSVFGEEFPHEIDLQDEIEVANSFYEEYLKLGRVFTSDPKLDIALDLSRIGAIKFRATTPGIGTGLMAGYASSRPGWFSSRPGYAWYFGRDSEWCSLALLDIGDFGTVRENLQLLMRYQRTDGKILHELTTSGIVHYDAADSTPLFLYVMYRYAMHSGDLKFVKDNWQSIVLAIEYCAVTDRNGDGLIENTIEGHGWIEGGKLYGASASFYLNCLWLAALRGVKELCRISGDSPMAKQVTLLEERAVEGMELLYDRTIGYVLGVDRDQKQMRFKTIMSSMGAIFDCVPKDRIAQQILEFASDDFSTDWGVRIIGKSSGLFNPKGYHEGSVWPLFTGWAALAQFALGADLDAFNHTLSSLYTFRDFSGGYIPEVLNGESYDQSGICPHQAWSETMGFQPFYEGVIGFRPDLLNMRLKLSPSIPLNLENLTIPALRVGNGSIGMSYRRKISRVERLETNQTYSLIVENSTEIEFSPFVPLYAENVQISVNGAKTAFKEERGITSKRLILNKSLVGEKFEIEVLYQSDFLLTPVEPAPEKHSKSKQPRIISLEHEKSLWKLTLRIPPGRSEVPIMFSERLRVSNALLKGDRMAIDSDNPSDYSTVQVTFSVLD